MESLGMIENKNHEAMRVQVENCLLYLLLMLMRKGGNNVWNDFFWESI